MKKSIPILLLLALFVIVSLVSHQITNRDSAPADGARSASAKLAAEQDHNPSDRRTQANRQESQRPANVSPPPWRPPNAFAKTGKPTPIQAYPRGENASRRYHEVVNRDIEPEHSSTIPTILAKSPEDGRFHLLPEEIDEHTLAAGRMVFDPTSLDRIVDGTTSSLLAPTLTDEVLTLEFDKIKTRTANTHTLQGHVAGEETTSLAQIVYHDGILHGTVMRYDTNQELEYRILPDGHMMVRQLDHTTMTGGCSTCEGEIMANVVDEASIGGEENYDFASEPEDPVSRDTTGWRTIDVTVGYTVQARIVDGGYSQIEARIIASVDRMTLAFANSAIANTELVLLGTIEDPDHVEHATQMVYDAHAKLRNETDGFLDVVTDFHHQLGSDLASIIVSSVQFGGVAGVAVSGSWSSANARSQMTSSGMTFEHELGHNLGCAHAWGDTSEGNTESNMGWRFIGSSGTKYTTIMAYSHVSSWGPNIPYFSNPNVLHPDGNVPTGAVDGYDATNDPTVDPALKLGFDGSVPTRGANNASTIDTGDGNLTYGATAASARATRTDFAVLAPAAAAQWEKGTTRTISFNGGDMDDLATIQLYKGGVLHTTLASGVNPVNHRNLAWSIPFSLTDGADYMFRVELNRNGSTIFADSGLFEIFSNLPHVNTASAPAVPAVIGQVSSLILTFNVPMNPASFNAGTDIVSFLNPEGSSQLGTITGASWSAGDTVLTIQFTPPPLQGTYQMTISPDLEDTFGNRMDQDGDGTTGESVEDRYTTTFHVNPPLPYYAGMDTDPGWTFSANNPGAGWAYGQPTGGTGQSPETSYPANDYNAGYGIADPTSGFNGPNVIGYNLNGDYERGITSTRWATTPAMDCSNYGNVRLRFQRWLGVYYGSSVYGGTLGDNAYIEVSNNGTTWTPVWHNTSSRLTSAGWVEVEYDISAVADGQSTVYVRWGMGNTNSSLNDDSCGWNIDEVIVHGDYVDNSDITPPYPSSLTFATPPTSLGVSAITMTASTALDANGVEYFFDETSGNPGGTDSGWQNSPTYTDTGLQFGTQYTYTVKARDKSPAQNEGTASSAASATTDASATLTLVIAAASVSESGGTGATTATVRRNTDTTSSLVVNLSSNDTSEITVPASITIAAGQSTSPVFNVNAVDDIIVDGTQIVTLTATAAGHANGTDSIEVTDDLPLTLTVITGTNGASSSGGGLKDPDGSPYAITASATTGHLFSNWTVTSGDASFGNETNASTTVDTASDATVQANFVVATYAVSYAGNGSDGGSVPVDASSPYDYNSTVTVLGNSGSLTRTGYNFAGWNTAANGSGNSYAPGSTFAISSNVTLHAQWTPNNYTVTFDANGGNAPNPSSKSVAFGSPYGALASVTRTGYSFNGWYTASSGGTQITEVTVVNATSDQTLYAQWTLNLVSVITDSSSVAVPEGNIASFGVKLSSQPMGTTTVTVSRSSGDADLNVQSGGSLTFTTANWDTYQTVTVSAALDDDLTDGAAIISCSPDNPSYTATQVEATEIDMKAVLTVTSGANGMTDPSGELIVNKGAATPIAATANTGYDFVNWTVTSGAATFGDANSATTTATIHGAAAVQANFAIKTYTISYSGNGNTRGAAPANHTKTYDISLTLATNSGNLLKTGFIFSGWNTAADGSGTDYAPDSIYTQNAPLALFAKWTPNDSQPVFTWADAYATSLDATLATRVNGSLNFPSYLDGPLTGSSTLTTSGYFGSLLYLVHNGATNTFNGDITVDGGTLRLTSSPFVANGGFNAPSMTSSDTITINRAGTLYIDDNFTSQTTGYTANRFGTDGNRPAVNLAGGRIELNGLNNASSSVQTFGALTASSGQSTLFVTRFTGNPTLEFGSLSISKGAVANFYSATLGTGTSDSRIKFTNTPTLTNGVLVGAKYWSPGAAGQGEFATYDVTNGVKVFDAYDVVSNDINVGTDATTNFQMTLATTPATLTADRAINSLNYKANGGTWSLGGNKLTIGSGMFLRNGTNTLVTIDTGTLTAGNGTDDIDLHFFTAQNSVTVNAVIADNASSVVSLVKSHGNTLSLSGGENNTYTGGTYVVDGTLTTGNVANRTYLGSGKVTVNNATLTLGNIGATSNATGDDYTVINGAQINIASGANGAYTSGDTFNIAANSIISGGSASGQGLASLTRDTNATLAPGAIIGHGQQSAALNTTTGTIQNLGTYAEVFYGLNANQNNSGGSITIGTGTAFQGISTDRTARAWQQGTINIASGTSIVDFQGLPAPGAAPLVLTLGNGTTAGGPVINFAGSGAVDIRALGPVALNDDTAVYGNTDSSPNVRFVATAGSTLTVSTATGMGSGNGIASALVQYGGLLAIGNSAALNGAVTVEGGGMLTANQAAGLTGTGQLTFNQGSILNITSQALGFSGTQASAASIAAGTIVRLGVNNYGAAGTTLDSIVGGSSPIYQLTTTVGAANPTSAGTTIMTLNKNGSGVGGILTNDLTGRTLNNTANGKITIGANGGVIAATSGTELQVQENIEGTNVTLTFGTSDIIDGAPKLGTVALGAGGAAGGNGYTGQTIINAGTVRPGYANVLGAVTNQLTVNGGTFNMAAGFNANHTVGNLTGTGGIINLGGTTLTIGQGDNGGGNYQGLIQGSGGKLTKVGAGTITLSGPNNYTGVTSINGGTLLINGDQSSASGNVTVAMDATLGGTGTIGGNTTIAASGKLEFNLSTDDANHDKLALASGKSLTFSGASVLTITSSGGVSPGSYILITAPGGITGNAPATLNLPVGWAATVSKVGNDLILNVTSTGGPGPVDHFVISAIASPQTVGTAITGITITAQDTANATATSFTGTVTFGGTAGITGASANFVDGELTGVSLMPTSVGTDRTLTVDDGAGQTGQAVFTVRSLFEAWAGTIGLTDGAAGSGANPDGDSLTNLQEFAFGMNPNSPTLSPLTYAPVGSANPGLPILENTGTTQSPNYRAVFARRKDYETAGLTYKVEFSANLTYWEPYATNHLPPVAGDDLTAVEAVAITFPEMVPLSDAVGSAEAPPKFFRVAVSGN